MVVGGDGPCIGRMERSHRGGKRMQLSLIRAAATGIGFSERSGTIDQQDSCY